ncbi:MAG TPA: SDR family NAD(P)-dependent oxidoreductase [Steroidobacteraceae bacterium]|nr:SDR family NAD(P)-dependent oxidoreductase [Steroidobacteraceae bacterium]
MATKKVLVVGGAGGVGSAVVNLLVDRGCQVVTTVLEPEEAVSIKERYGGMVQCHVVDLSNSDAALIKFKEIVSSMDHLNAVAVCAATAPCGPLELTPLSTYRKAYEINCVSEVAVYQATMPALRQTGGRIVLLGSVGGRIAYTFMSAYIATKFALEGLCDVMRREAAPRGVKVSLVQPGGIRTNMVHQQVVDARRDLAALDEKDRDLHGYLYEGYMRVAERGLGEGASTAEQVAEVVLEALEADEPESRYVAGEEAKHMLGSIGTMSDRDIDRLFNEMFLR